ncbi:MAG TPA: alpha-hydroxy acid oxidase [Vicinamibacterales bacterium]|nr:alpha-hydroxy acid oxidase [Vicinamibacterales bacterium]
MSSETRLARSVTFPRVINIADFRRLARRRLPSLVFDYIDGGAEDEVTLRANERAFREVVFRPRQGVAVPSCDLRTTVLGTTLDLPFLLAPVGFCRMFHPNGEVRAAHAANAAGTAYILSTFSGTRLEEVRAGAAGQLWYQLYMPGGRAVAESAIARARAAGYQALVVTIDTPVAGMRERDYRRGALPIMRGRFWASLPHLGQFVTRPRWVANYVADGAMRVFPNVELPDVGPMPCGDVGALLEKTVVTWEDMRWMRDAWRGRFVVKGVHTGDDARRAIDAGADAVVVSNHGGRQLDGVAASLRALPEVVSAAGGQAEVLMDGGIRRGSDIVKALCLGARAVLIGRAYAWALGAAGEPGVARAIEILRADLVRTLRLLGCRSIGELDRSYVEVPSGWSV